MSSQLLPLTVYGLEVSYFTGKLEGYLRYKEIPYERIDTGPASRHIRHTGAGQIPVVQLADGRCMTDTTPIIAWLEEQFPDPRVIPVDPVQAFFSLLIEDYGDEWLWRPAMHYRWSYRADALHLSRRIADTLPEAPSLRAVARLLVRLRQRHFFVRRDGVRRATLGHVEGTYTKVLAQLETMFATRPYLLGEVPTIGDFGLFGSMFRHFGTDPTPASIMRETAPRVYAWVARMWAASASHTSGPLAPGIPDDWAPLLEAIGRTHLRQLAANAAAWRTGRKRFDLEVEGIRYRNLRTARYRVWCLEKLQGRYRALPEPAQTTVREMLERHGCWEPLFRVAAASGIDPQGRAPFSAGHSMTGVRLVR